MTTRTDIANRSLQYVGTRTTVTDAELLANSTNEAIQLNLCMDQNRDDLLRMAPWDCALETKNLTYISSVPGTPENTSPATTLWMPGQPAPPWAYEYQYPADCLRACWIIPAAATGYSGGVPITTAVTGGSAAFWRGPPVLFKVQTDQFYPVTAVAVANGGSGYALGDIITLPYGPYTSPPIGAPLQIRVTNVLAGVITEIEIVPSIIDTEVGGSYFAPQSNPIAQGLTTGVGINATFNLTFGARGRQRVILTNQEFATLVYCVRVVDPNVMDTLFQTAWANINAATVAVALTGDRKKANDLIAVANKAIQDARAVDGNEGLTINDVTPDFIRIRGITTTEGYSGPFSNFDWGSFWPTF